MATNPRHYYTLDEYFAVELAGDARYEYWDGEIVCMSGGSPEHSQISGNLYFLLRLQLDKKKCRAFTSDQAVKNFASPIPPYFYPDASIVCGKANFESIRGIGLLANPTLLAEVVSPTSESRDRNAKLEFYKRIPSLKEYLIVAQDRPEIIRHFKQDDGSWTNETFSGLNAVVFLPSVRCSLALADIYENVGFEKLV